MMPESDNTEGTLRCVNGWVPVRDILKAAGYRKLRTALYDTVKDLGVAVERRHLAGAPNPPYCVPQADAGVLVELLRGHRDEMVKYTPAARRALAERARPRVSPLRSPGKEHALNDDMMGLTRRLKQVLPKLGVEEYVLARDEKAEGGMRCAVTRSKLVTEEIK